MADEAPKDGQQQQSQEGAEGAPKSVTMSEEDLGRLISRQVNAAITAHLKRQKEAAAPPSSEAEEATTIKALNAKLKKLEDERESERRSVQMARRENEVVSALTRAGAAHVDGALALLERKGKIVQADDGTVMFRKKVESYEGTPIPEDVPLEEGLKSWLSSEEGSYFAASRGTGGSGARQGRASQQQTRSAPANSVEKRRLELAERLAEKIYGGGR